MTATITLLCRWILMLLVITTMINVCNGFVISPVAFAVSPQQQHQQQQHYNYDSFSHHERILSNFQSRLPSSSSSSRRYLFGIGGGGGGGGGGGDDNDIGTSLIHIPTPVVVIVVLLGAFWAYIESAPDQVMKRQRQRERAEYNAKYKEFDEQRQKLSYVEPKEYWTEAELADYDGTAKKNNSSSDDDDDGNDDHDYGGPILFAADGLVFNVSKGRNFYGPGGEYHIMAGRDATRLLARTIVEEETKEDAAKPLTMAERAALAGWMWTIKSKYEIVGKLEGFDESTTKM